MFSRNDARLCANPAQINNILASQLLSHIPAYLGRWLLILLLLALQRVETHRLVGANGVDVGAGVHETCVRNRRAVVDDLVQGVVFVGLGAVEDVEEAIGAG